jgi:hypothetical protein
MGGGIRRVEVGVLATVVLALALGAPAASAQALSPWWGVTAGSEPTDLVTGKTGRIVVTAENRGDASTAGEVTIVDGLPPGLDATGIEGVAGELSTGQSPVSCTLETLTCSFSGSLRPYEQIEVDIAVSVQAGASSGERNSATVSGGGATRAASATRAIEVDGRERFGIEDYELLPEEAGGAGGGRLDTQAGSHPFQLTSVLTFDTGAPGPSGGPRTVALPRDISVALPAGLIADPAAIVRCGEAQFDQEDQANGESVGHNCPAQSVLGAATVSIEIPPTAVVDTITTPIFNVQPLPGEPARFAMAPHGIFAAFLETSLRSGSDYGVTLALTNSTQKVWLLGVKLSVWGVPGDQRHDGQRGLECLGGFGVCPSSSVASPLLTMPTTCAGPLQSTVEGDSWQQANVQQAEAITPTLQPLASTIMPALDGCDALPFHPEIYLAPDGRQASTPNGFDVDVRVHDEGASNPADLAASTVKDITVALPAGVALNPAVADGLEACSQGLVGFIGFGELEPVTEPGVKSPAFTGKLPGSLAALVAGEDEPLQPGVNFCPNASKIGTVKLKTPLLAGPLEGDVYLAAPYENPFASLVAVYVVAEEPTSGVLVKLGGELSLNQQTGQITASLQNTPQLPFEELDLDFFEGERAPLSTPARCGSYTTDASFLPWAAEPSDVAAVTVDSSSTFDITTGPHGTPCPGATLPFAPSVTAGTTNIDAGSFTPLSVTVGRGDGQQAIESVQLKLPPGLSAILAGVALCPEAQANTGTCGPESEIGETTLGVGLGDDPYTITGGKVYLTEPYEGAPFGLSIAVPARVGPFTLREGRPIVVRAKLEIDPATAALTIATGTGTGAGSGGIPSIVEGFSLQIQHLNITIGRPGFTLNPTSCNPMSITGMIDGSEGASAPMSSSFQVANCAGLPFSPKVTALTRANGEFSGHGASLHIVVKNTGGQANVRALKVDLPQRLPARLETIQHACPESAFDANPAACPNASVVGSAVVQTAILSTAMTGPAYLVARNGTTTSPAGASTAAEDEAAFPDLVLVLQGQGVRIDLTGGLYVNEKNITSATFRELPDIPIGRLDLILPEGPRSILAASSGLCTKKPLTMTSAIDGQNGAWLKPTVTVAVEGCKKPVRRDKRRHCPSPRRRPSHEREWLEAGQHTAARVQSH